MSALHSSPSGSRPTGDSLAALGFDSVVIGEMLARWGDAGARERLAAELEKGKYPVPAQPSPVPRGQPPVSTPAERLYWGLIHDQGPNRGNGLRPPPPPPTRAWLEVLARKDVLHPTFSHPSVVDALEALGGYEVLGRMGPDRARTEFVRVYKELNP